MQEVMVPYIGLIINFLVVPLRLADGLLSAVSVSSKAKAP